MPCINDTPESALPQPQSAAAVDAYRDPDPAVELADAWRARAADADGLIAAQEGAPAEKRRTLDEGARAAHCEMADIDVRMLATSASTMAGIAGKVGTALSIATIALGADGFDADWQLVASAARDLAALTADATA